MDTATALVLSSLPRLAHCDLGYCDGVSNRVLAALGFVLWRRRHPPRPKSPNKGVSGVTLARSTEC